MKKSTEFTNYYMRKYGHDYNFMVYRFNFEKLYRGRPFSKMPEDKVLKKVQEFRDVWVPPENLSTKQRCNESGKSILYLASHYSTIPYELELRTNDLFVVCKFKQIDEFLNVPILGWEKLMEIGEPKIINIIKNYFGDKSDLVKTIDREIAEIFTSRRLKTGKDIYDKTIGLSNLFFQNEGDGLLYPSVADKFKSINLALNPDRVRQKLRPVNILLFKLIRTDFNQSIEVEVLREGLFDDALKISWSNRFQGKSLRYEKNLS